VNSLLELEEGLRRRFGNDWYLVQEGRIVSLVDLDEKQVVRLYRKLRGGMMGLFVRFAPRKDGQALDLETLARRRREEEERRRNKRQSVPYARKMDMSGFMEEVRKIENGKKKVRE
jgi:hypothetical protein